MYISADSEMTWPHTPMTEADEVIRDYLPGLFDSEVHPTEPVTGEFVSLSGFLVVVLSVICRE